MKLLLRGQWGATAPLGPAMTLPARGVTFHQSVTTATSNVAADMRTLERIGVQRFGRFSYCYAIHPTGVVGVGAGATVGAHTKGHNSTRFGVVFIKQDADPLTAAAEAAAVELVRHLTPSLVPAYTVDGHRDYKATACPSDAVYGRLGAIHAAARNPQPEVPDMTDEQARMLREVWEALCTSRDEKAPAGETVLHRVQQIDTRTADLASGRRP